MADQKLGPQLVNFALAQDLAARAEGEPHILIFRATDQTLQLIVSFTEALPWADQVAAIARRLNG